ncbi:sensor histidine kinase [Dyadobacter flavalbus]|uniref:histidine kinase n=1 Tax=Dyadobacter flavalbus TaxID=2579942 RepID=A0A5M8R058_9BACT|nr:sensor histidine kinase [Dyadobacter flavalbus]KAA6440384.1 sensor histidine kinase [Dyadobacter flavalbus]
MAENEKPHFDISAAVIRQLGEELVTDEVTAIMELIKNSYDADADWVKVEVNLFDYYSDERKFYKDSARGFILIEDNGFGMSDTDIANSWMKISLSAKKKFKEEGRSTLKGRTPLGEKGVGRLSTQRLGSRLEMFTGQVNHTSLSHVAFDWALFQDDTLLTSVPVHIDSFPKRPEKKGTSLVITNLKETNKWKGDSWDKFRGQISQMIFPFKERRAFDVYLKLNGETVDLDEVNRQVRSNSVAQYNFRLDEQTAFIEGKIKLQKLSGGNKRDDIAFFEGQVLPDQGSDFFHFLTDKKENKQHFLSDIIYSGEDGVFFTFRREVELSMLSKIAYIEIDSLTSQDIIDHEGLIPSETSLNDHLDDTALLEIADPGNFEGEISDFNFKETDEIEKAFDTFSEFKRLVQNQVGIRIFRDGFGIKPYGIDGQDWLKLSGNQTSGGSFYGLRPGNVVGYVTISASENRDLKEKTDREGFVDSAYSRNFFRIMEYFVDEINTVLENTRRSFNKYRSKRAQANLGIQSISDSFVKLRGASEKAKKSTARAATVRFNLANVTNQIKEIVEEKSQAEGYDAGTNEILVKVNSILQEAELLLTEVESILGDARILDQHVEFLQPQITNLEQQLSDFAQLAGLGLTAEALSHELSNIVDRILFETDRISQNLRLRMEPDFLPVKVYIEHIRNASKSFRKQLSHLAPSLRFVRDVKEEFAITEFLADLESYYVERFATKIRFNVQVVGRGYMVNMNRGKLTQVLDNVILNSEYWLNERRRGEPNFYPEINIVAQSPFLRIYDNGFGVDPAVQEQLFQPFVTAKPKNKGRGLGLFITQQLLETEGCEIHLLNVKNDFGRRYIFQLNFSAAISN